MYGITGRTLGPIVVDVHTGAGGLSNTFVMQSQNPVTLNLVGDKDLVGSITFASVAPGGLGTKRDMSLSRIK
jgi:hypothetical protein